MTETIIETMEWLLNDIEKMDIKDIEKIFNDRNRFGAFDFKLEKKNWGQIILTIWNMFTIEDEIEFRSLRSTVLYLLQKWF